jgi:hypothetical protein
LFRQSAGAEADIKRTLQQINNASSKAQIQGWIRVLNDQLASAANSMVQQYNRGTGENATVGNFMSTQSVGIMSTLGQLNFPGTRSPQGNYTITTTDGRKLTFPGNIPLTADVDQNTSDYRQNVLQDAQGNFAIQNPDGSYTPIDRPYGGQ